MEVDSTHTLKPFDLNSLLSRASMNHSEFRSHEMSEEVQMTVNVQEPDKPLSAGAPAGVPTRCPLSAAMRVQKVYRGYRTRRMLADSTVVAEELWWQNHSTISFFNFLKSETAASRWNRVSLNASKVGKGLSKDAKAQTLACKHWIEAIDPRHRYGHSLHLYHEDWCKTNAGQPFFYWLDLGDGKEVDLEECPRSKLRQQCIKYLGPSGFQDESVKIMKAIQKGNSSCQVLLFSATFNDAVRVFVSKIVKEIFVRDYNQMFVKKEELSLESVKQYKVQCPDELSKIMVIKDKIFEIGEKVGQTIIFVRSRNSASMLHQALVKYGYEVTTIQGALKQEDRDRIIKEFKEGLTQVLISTDLLARGFDQSQVNLVVNFNLPVRYDNPSEPDYEVYLHRVGRAGRFGRKGAVFNLLCDDGDNMIMDKIERHFNAQITELGSWKSNEDFEDALKKAGLL